MFLADIRGHVSADTEPSADMSQGRSNHVRFVYVPNMSAETFCTINVTVYRHTRKASDSVADCLSYGVFRSRGQTGGTSVPPTRREGVAVCPLSPFVSPYEKPQHVTFRRRSATRADVQSRDIIRSTGLAVGGLMYILRPLRFIIN